VEKNESWAYFECMANRRWEWEVLNLNIGGAMVDDTCGLRGIRDDI